MRLVFCLTFGLVAAVSAFAQPRVALGERVGLELDAAERTYFGLFPSIEGAMPFRFQTVDDSVRVVSAESKVVRVLTQDQAGRLVGILDTFEDYPDVVSNPAWEANAGFLDLIDARTPIPRAVPSRRIRAMTAEGSYSGYVLYTTDSLLVLAPDVIPTDPQLPGAFVLPRSRLTSVDRATGVSRQGWGPYAGAALGAGLGAAVAGDRLSGAAFGLVLGATFADVGSRLRGGQGGLGGSGSLEEMAYFDTVRPPEMPGPDVAETLVDRPVPSPGPLPKRPRRHEWVSVGVHGGVQVNDEGGLPGIQGIGVRLVDQQGQPTSFRDIDVLARRNPLEVASRIDVAIRPLPWVRVGAYIGAFDSLSVGGPGGEDGREYIAADLGSVRPYGELILPLSRIGRRRVELAAGMGRETHTLTVRQAAPDRQNGYPVELGSEQLTQQEGTNWFSHVAAELYTTPFSSFFVRYAWHPLPSMEVAEFSSQHRTFAPLTLRTVYEHEVEFGFTELIIGARVHL
ncbi:MAG: hypothetical protein AAF170_06940 [Bacteroidota bacterium]